ncbi:unnamed protein product [Phytophthora lilii]|uniref:RxLR effector protein n=1 Tax=Phytophthora lilii TaxID=2077276 RepID=A0A9W6WR57_9STRA|nr:unnamed protein product [Phytophthora lilii]
MRLSYTFLVAIVALVVGTDSALAADSSKIVAEASIRPDDHRFLNAHKVSDADDDEERGVADVVDDVMAKLKADKFFADVLKSQSVRKVDDLDDLKVNRLDDMLESGLAGLFKSVINKDENDKMVARLDELSNLSIEGEELSAAQIRKVLVHHPLTSPRSKPISFTVGNVALRSNPRGPHRVQPSSRGPHHLVCPGA